MKDRLTWKKTMFSSDFAHHSSGLRSKRTRRALLILIPLKQTNSLLMSVCFVKLDLEKYRPLLADSGMTREQEDIFLHATWQFCEGIIDREFGLHPAQQVDLEPLQKFAGEDSSLLESNKAKT